MPLNDNGRNVAVDALALAADFTSIHTAIPDATGSAEIAGGTYARVATAYSAAAAGAAANNAQLTHNIPAGNTVVAYGHWSALNGGTYYGHTPRVGAGAGQGSIRGFGTVDAADVTANTITSSGHGLANDMRVGVYNVLAETLPAGLTEGTLYFVVGAATDTFQLSLTSGGAAVDITGQGELYFARFLPDTFSSDGTLVTQVGALTISGVVI